MSWRKPAVFGVSNALIFASLHVASRAQGLAPRGPTAHTAAWATAMEVAIITLQARALPHATSGGALELGGEHSAILLTCDAGRGEETF